MTYFDIVRMGSVCNFTKMERDVMLQDVFYPQNNGELSDSITQNWTEQAIECYTLKGDCKNCSIAKGNYSFVCQMPKVIEVLKTIYGEPDTTNTII